MTENHLAGLWTLIAMIAFISICLWAYSAKRRTDFDEAANLPFADEDEDRGTEKSKEKGKESSTVENLAHIDSEHQCNGDSEHKEVL